MSIALPQLSLEPGERLADAVYAIIRRSIVRHELAPGLHLSVPAIASQLGISRSPVHEAIKRLVQEGLATEEPRRGAFVTVYSPPALLPLYEVRCALEGLTATLAAERASTEAIEAMRRVLAAEAEAIARDDIERHIEIDIEFHRLLMGAAANPTLEEMLGQIYERIRAAMVSRVVPTGPHAALSDHQAILAGVASRNGAQAGAAATAHVMRVYGKLSAQRVASILPGGFASPINSKF